MEKLENLEIEEVVRELIDTIKHKLISLPENNYIKNILSNDDIILKFLRSRKFNIEKTFNTITNWIDFHINNSKWFEYESYEDFRLFEQAYNVLPNPDSLGRVIIICNAKTIVDVLKKDDLFVKKPHLFTMSQMWVFERIQLDYNAQVHGLIVIVNFQGLTVWDQLLLPRIVVPSERILLIKYVQDCLGMRLKGLIATNEPLFFTIISNIVKPFLNEKLRKRLIVCGSNYYKINEIIPDMSILPINLGGNATVTEITWLRNQID